MTMEDEQQILIEKFNKIFESTAKMYMKEFDLTEFMITHPSLHSTILMSMKLAQLTEK